MASHKVLGIIFALMLLLLTSTAFACNISVSGLDVSVKSEDDTQFDSSITTNQNTDISIRIQFDVDSYSGNGCPSTISAQPKIYRYNNDTGNWEAYKTSTTKSQTLSQDTMTLTWTNEFNTGNNSKYTQFRIDGNVFNGSEVLDTQESFVDVENSSCSGINIVANDTSIDEGQTTTRTFYLENNTSNGFSISNVALYTTNSLIHAGTVDYDNYVPAHGQQAITVTLDAGFVTTDTTTALRLEVSGDLSGKSCSPSDIGIDYIDVTVRNTGSNDYSNGYYNNYDYYGGYSTSSDCDLLELQTNDVSINEGETQQEVFGLKNNSATVNHFAFLISLVL